MFLRTRDIPDLENLTDQHRQQIISQVESMVFWKPKPLILVTGLLCLGIAIIYSAFRLMNLHPSLWVVSASAPAIATYGGFAIYRIVGLNSFYRPAIKTLVTDLPPERASRPMLSKVEKGMVVSFVLVAAGILLLVISFGQR